MSIVVSEAEMAEDRAEAESRMTLTVDIGIPGPWQRNPATGNDERTLTSAFTTKARIRVRSAQSVRDSEVGDRTATSVDRELHIAWDSPGVRAESVARVTAVSDLDDPSLLGAELVLSGPAPGSQTTARRLLVREFVLRATEEAT